MPQQQQTQKDVSSYQPKTRGSVGILVVGLGGANGTTMACGILANRNYLEWKGARGEDMSHNYYGCVTQLNQKGIHGGVGYRNKVKGLADASMAAVGGWDIRPAKLGDALLDHQILDYDLVRQSKDEMNRIKVFRGYYDPRFIGSSQHVGATHILSEKEAPDASEALKRIRADIRYFKWRNGVVGHTTVIWSASVEPNADLCSSSILTSAKGLLSAIEMTEEERGGPLPPSLIYATAAILEGCSFVNGGSQNTLCEGLAELAKQQFGVYCLGTDFKAGQTKFKTAAVEYIRTMGLTPKVIASSNHLGNNDMKNLATADKARMAKLRVKHDIFAAWQEDIDHKVAVMYTPIINDEKRDFVEYTSQGFLGQTHTMVTYTRASDSVLCVPLMIDAAVWCDFFSRQSWPYENTAKALAYLFKVPEGAAKGVDPGFFRQMDELTRQALAACKETHNQRSNKVRIRSEADKGLVEWVIPNDACIICAGLACVDMQLNQATGGDGGESIETFQGETSIGGGSVSMASKTLSRLYHGAPLEEKSMEVTPPVVHSVIPLCKVGNDDTGNKLISLLEATGGESRNVVTKYIKNARKKHANARTALAILPIYQDGRRGCFFDAASNTTFSASEMIEMISDVMPAPSSLHATNLPHKGAFLFGYPHLLPTMQGDALARIFSMVRAEMDNGGIIAMDLNGVPEKTFSSATLRSVDDLKEDKVIGQVLPQIDILHMNEEELVYLTGCSIQGTKESKVQDENAIKSACSLFLRNGVAIIAVTRGSNGCYITCNNSERFAKSKMLPSSWIDSTAVVKAVELPEGTVINSNGAGDAFTSGLLVAAMLRHTGITLAGLPNDGNQIENDYDDDMSDLLDLQPPLPLAQQNKLTPYTLYMQEHYVSLKAQCNDDKKAMFTKCHDMWENESEEMKMMYERRCNEEIEDSSSAVNVSSKTEFLDTDKTSKVVGSDMRYPPKSVIDSNLVNKSLNLETAAHFANLVAAYHVDTATRNDLHLDMSILLERALISSHGLEEI